MESAAMILIFNHHLQQNLFPDLTACGLTVLPQMSSCVHQSEYCHGKRLPTPFFINGFACYNVLMIKIMELPLDFGQILPHITLRISK